MIEIKNTAFHYTGLDKGGLKNINLKIMDSECVLLCGASGCGKTTLTRLINGLIPHFYKGALSGEVIVNDKNIGEQELYSLAGVVGSVFQNPRSQFFSVDTDGEITFGPENIGLPKEEILKRKKNVITELNLRDLMNRSLFELSGGEKQKIACGSVAALLPHIILLDEPSSNLDWSAIRDLRKIIKLWKNQGKTIIISEHRLWYLKDIIDRILYLEQGEIVHEWTQERFAALSDSELASYELRPLNLEERYIQAFSGDTVITDKDIDKVSDKKEILGEPQKKRIVIKDLYFTYTPKKYLFFKKRLSPVDADSCTLRIPFLSAKLGEIIGIIGNNGSGKSTFLRCLCGLEKTCIGTVSIDGKIYTRKNLTKNCYMVMQDVNHQLFTDSVITEVMLSMEHPDEKKAEKILASLDLLQYKDKHPMALSGGQKQRVAIASAMAADAVMLLFDEPTSGLDYRHMKEVSVLLKELAKKGKTIFVATHDPELAAECCDRTIRFVNGYAWQID
jgi:ATPase components of various ABC-type transport systems, contain duplicated ATPase